MKLISEDYETIELDDDIEQTLIVSKSGFGKTLSLWYVKS